MGNEDVPELPVHLFQAFKKVASDLGLGDGFPWVLRCPTRVQGFFGSQTDELNVRKLAKNLN